MSWLVVDPHVYVLALIAAALALRALGRGRASMVVIAAALALIVVAGVLPTGQIALWSLESRFPVWTGEGPPPTGIVLLGGAINGLTPYPGSGFSEVSGRFFEAVALAHRFPEAKVVYSGGGGEAFRGSALMIALGVGSDRILVEGWSRSTAENAAFSARVVKPQPGEKWLLVTSAWHMPRAVGSFKAAGFPVEAYPVDFRARPWRSLDIGIAYALFGTAFREYAALVAIASPGERTRLFRVPDAAKPISKGV